ncbi:Divalent anion:Na symporter protein [Pelomyxa schiedti]|nr:Divalent anion:Na symporter protein [Pelomyxa schiedti]
MKFGKLLAVSSVVEWREHYLRYARLKRQLQRLKEISVSRPSENDALMPKYGECGERSALEREFFVLLEEDIATVSQFFATEIDKLTEKVRTVNKEDKRNVEQCYKYARNLQSYRSINFTGFRKIVKKFDKISGCQELPRFMERIQKENFSSPAKISTLVESLRSLLPYSTEEWEEFSVQIIPPERTFKIVRLILSVICGVSIFFIPFLPPDKSREHSCFALLGFIVSKALPYFATALMVPVMVVWLGVLDTKSTEESALLVMSSMFDHITILMLGGFTLAECFGITGLERFLAGVLQNRLSKHPRVYILSVMIFGMVLSMWLSNATAPVLILPVITPLLRDLPTTAPYSRALVLGVAFGCNIGGTLSPVSSPQNVVALSALHAIDRDISFGKWCCAALLFGIAACLATWGALALYVVFMESKFDHHSRLIIKSLPLAMHLEKHSTAKLSTRILAACTCAAAVGAWATIGITKPVIGDLGLISLAFCVIVFGARWLEAPRITPAFQWHLLVLVGGGKVLSLALRSSGALAVASEVLAHLLRVGSRTSTSTPQLLTNSTEFICASPFTAWCAQAQLVIATVAATTFVSHTVAALIMVPLAVQIGDEALGCVPLDVSNTSGPTGAGAELAAFVCALACSSSMVLAVSSIPNAVCSTCEDDWGKPYLSSMHYAILGALATLTSTVLVCTVGFFAARLLFS